MSRRLLVWPLWGLTTAVATTVCWTGVSVVTASITATHSPAIPAREVHAALAAPSDTDPPGSRPPSTLGAAAASPGAAPAAGKPGAIAGTTPGRTGGAELAGAAGSRANPATAESSGAAPVVPPQALPPPVPPPVPSPFPAAPAAPPPAPVPPPPSQPSGSSDGTHHYDGGSGSSTTTSSSTPPSQGTAAPNGAPVTATFSTTGGTATVSCQGSVISLVSASPANGYTLDVQQSGPTWVVVAFDAQPRNSLLHAKCSNGQPVKITDD